MKQIKAKFRENSENFRIFLRANEMREKKSRNDFPFSLETLSTTFQTELDGTTSCQDELKCALTFEQSYKL